MCVQDLNLGRGRYPGKTVTLTATALQVLTPNPKRVAIVIGFIGVSAWSDAVTGDIMDTFTIFSSDRNQGPVVASGCGPITPAVLRVEDLGQLITGTLSVLMVNASGDASLSIQEIITQIEGKPAFTDADLK